MPAPSAVFALVAALLLNAAAAQPARDLAPPPPLPATAAPARAATDAVPAAPIAPRVGPPRSDAEPADLPPADTSQPQARIEQRRQGNRVVELTVTPAGSMRSYSIANREGQRPLSVQELSAGLSTPRFLKFEF